MIDFPKTPKNTVKRLHDRASYDVKTIHSILDAAFVCHVSFIRDGQPFIIPTLHARSGERLLLHGSQGSRLMQHIQAGQPVCIAVTILDGLVLARAVFNHSVNYRSVVLFGSGEKIDDLQEKTEALRLFTEKLVPGRWVETRPPNKKELNTTAIVSISIDSASAKIRQGMPHDSDEDMDMSVWAGIIPVAERYEDPQVDPDSRSNVQFPDYLHRLISETR